MTSEDIHSLIVREAKLEINTTCGTFYSPLPSPDAQLMNTLHDSERSHDSQESHGTQESHDTHTLEEILDQCQPLLEPGN